LSTARESPDKQRGNNSNVDVLANFSVLTAPGYHSINPIQVYFRHTSNERYIMEKDFEKKI